MRSLFALAAVCGLVSAGNLYTYRGTSHINLQQFINPSELPPVEPYGNYTNQTIFNENIYVEDKQVVKFKVDHGIDIGYSGSYKSGEVDVVTYPDLWALSYELNTYGKITETFTLDIANFYSFKVEVVLDVFRLQLLKQKVVFVHPWAIFKAKNEEPSVTIPFDLKLESQFKVNKLLDLSIMVADSMRANFNKQLDELFKEMFFFAETAVVDEEYIPPEDDTKNIANALNYLPSAKDFKKGGEVFTNAFGPEAPNRRIPLTKWDIPVVLEIIRWVVKNQDWEWDAQNPINHWIFKTRSNTDDNIPVVAP